ncbi:MAG: RIP metalloprotease RseP [Opitutales bacterium]|nr:RIP metalloprotease RseP [Opitutales bacterium]
MELLSTLFSSLWAIFWIIIFFAGTVFVHEYGHFIAARKRGLIVERFSIGFGPKIFSWTRDGVEYRVSWLPLGGYVALPQLGEMEAIEGETNSEPKKLPPISYSSKMIVAVMGAVFNVLFALALSFLLWVIGHPVPAQQNTTVIGHVAPTLMVADEEHPSPAAAAGLQRGDKVLSVDGREVGDFADIQTAIFTGSRRDEAGKREVRLEVERDGEVIEVPVRTVLAGFDRLPMIGISGAHPVIVESLTEGFPAERAGMQVGDRVVKMDGEKVYSLSHIQLHLQENPDRPTEFLIERNGEELTLAIQPRLSEATATGRQFYLTGFTPKQVSDIVHLNPIEQVDTARKRVFQTLASLVNPASDVGLRHLSGPVGITRIFYLLAQTDFRQLLWFTIFINVNLAILNLLPIPVLDGGHMVFATIQKIRGKPLPASVIGALQGTFMLLLLFMMLYVTYFDSRRWIHDRGVERDMRNNEIVPVEEPVDPPEEENDESEESPEGVAN